MSESASRGERAWVLEPAIFVLDHDALQLEAIVRAVEPLGQVKGASAWTEVAGHMLRAVREPRRQVVLICDLDGAGARNAEFCRVVRSYAPRVRVVVFSESASGVPQALGDVVVSKASGLESLARATAVALGPGVHGR